jgi:hypothetical protein
MGRIRKESTLLNQIITQKILDLVIVFEKDVYLAAAA